MVCADCGSADVQLAAWVDPNTGQIFDDFGSWDETDSKFCTACDANVLLVERSDETAPIVASEHMRLHVIETEIRPATDRRGTRILARSAATKLWGAYQHELSPALNHAVAAAELANRQGWLDGHVLRAGERLRGDGYTFLLLPTPGVTAPR